MKLLRVVAYTLVWLSITLYILYASYSARAHRGTQSVVHTNIILKDSCEQGNLITTSMVESWIKHSGVKTFGVNIDSLKIADLETAIAQNGFVERVKCYLSYNGVLSIEIEERNPTLRLILDGYNSYLTEDGHIFKAPYSSAHYVPVVTGGYRPYFDPSFSGEIELDLQRQLSLLDERIEKIEREEKYPLYKKRKDNVAIRKEEGYKYTRRKWKQTDEEFKQEVIDLKRENAANRRYYSAIIHDIDQAIVRVEQKQEKCRDEQKKLRKRYEDIINLITFVKRIEKDKFWRSEVVQIVADKASNGELRVNLIPRSGDYRIIVGPLEETEKKLDNLAKFYQTILRGGGWSQFESVSVEYKNQIVCK